MFERRKFIARTNHTLIGRGATKEEARADLKAQLEAYRANPTLRLMASGPGMFARPELALYLIEERLKSKGERQ